MPDKAGASATFESLDYGQTEALDIPDSIVLSHPGWTTISCTLRFLLQVSARRLNSSRSFDNGFGERVEGPEICSSTSGSAIVSGNPEVSNALASVPENRESE